MPISTHVGKEELCSCTGRTPNVFWARFCFALSQGRELKMVFKNSINKKYIGLHMTWVWSRTVSPLVYRTQRWTRWRKKDVCERAFPFVAQRLSRFLWKVGNKLVYYLDQTTLTPDRANEGLNIGTLRGKIVGKNGLFKKVKQRFKLRNEKSCKQRYFGCACRSTKWTFLLTF